MESCFECDSIGPLIKHYVVPRSLGGKRTLLLCSSCHGKVHDKSCVTHAILTKRALDKRRKNNQPISRTPFGFDLTSCGKFLKKNLHEQKIIQQILDMRKNGMSFPKIAQALTERRIPTKRGKTVWEHSTIRGLVKRHGKKEKTNGR